jgi:hypothetical protein
MSDLKCPKCSKHLTMDHLRANEDCDRYIARLGAIRSASKRVTPSGGRPSLCGECGKCRNCANLRTKRRKLEKIAATGTTQLLRSA